MGMMKPYSSCYTQPSAVAPNPNPEHYLIRFIRKYANATLVYVTYAGCTNFEGNKILVYLGTFKPDESKPLDPHFCESGESPIARFRPDKEGYALAINLCKLM